MTICLAILKLIAYSTLLKYSDSSDITSQPEKYVRNPQSCAVGKS